ncbi:MAG: hypothetical protein K6E91_04455 [Butyrivibrio sp.]|nr:hypothetical protein [Butyrivibrio sp.]
MKYINYEICDKYWLYDENHKCKIGFITRIGSNDKTFKELIRSELSTIEAKENFVKYEDR